MTTPDGRIPEHETILIVDDSEETLGMLRTILGEEGYTVSVATSGEKAMSRIHQITPDLILLDVVMPSLNGFEVCKRLKEVPAYSTIPIIFLSGLVDTEDKVKAFQNGGVDYLIKPVAPQELVARVKTHLSISRLERDLQRVNQSLEERVRERTSDLIRANTELGEENARKIQIEESLRQATLKLNLLNTLIFTDIKNAIFTLSGYLELEKEFPREEQAQQFLVSEINLTHSIMVSLNFSQQYQNLGTKPPEWQNLLQAFLYGISHVDLVTIGRDVDIGGIEIYADPLLEQIFTIFTLNVLKHANATRIALKSLISDENLTIIFEDDGTGISYEQKESIFDKRTDSKRGLSLFLVREILSLTNISIKETGIPGEGARFEIVVPKGVYRLVPFSDTI